MPTATRPAPAGATAERTRILDLSLYLRFILALAAVLALIAGAAWLVRRFGLFGVSPGRRPDQRRLAINAVQPLDARRRLVLVRRDGVEHLLLIGGANDLLIESGIAAPKPAASLPPASLPATDPGARNPAPPASNQP